ELLAQLAGELDAVDRPGQPDIDERQGRGVFRRQRKRLGARGGDAGDAEPGFAENLFDVARDERLVLDDQDADRLASILWRNHLKLTACHRRASSLRSAKMCWRPTRRPKNWFQVPRAYWRPNLRP